MESFDVEVVREFEAPIARVWAAWVEPEGLRQWWGPQGFTCPRAEVDARPGGRISVTMRAPLEWGGSEHHSTWSITELQEPTRLAYVHQFADAEGNALTPAEAGVPMDGVPGRSEHEVDLVDLGDGRTRLHMLEHGYGTESARDLSKSGLEECLDKMAVLVEASGTAAP